jgi:hypothetical protein
LLLPLLLDPLYSLRRKWLHIGQNVIGACASVSLRQPDARCMGKTEPGVLDHWRLGRGRPYRGGEKGGYERRRLHGTSHSSPMCNKYNDTFDFGFG